MASLKIRLLPKRNNATCGKNEALGCNSSASNVHYIKNGSMATQVTSLRARQGLPDNARQHMRTSQSYILMRTSLSGDKWATRPRGKQPWTSSHEPRGMPRQQRQEHSIVCNGVAPDVAPATNDNVPRGEMRGTGPVVVVDNYDSFTYNLCQVAVPAK